MKGQAMVSTMLFLIMMVSHANAGQVAQPGPAPCSDLNAVNGNMTQADKTCYDSVMWAKMTGCAMHPEWYEAEGLTSCKNGSILDFQCGLWKMRGKRREGESHNCTRPCNSVLCTISRLDQEKNKRIAAANATAAANAAAAAAANETKGSVLPSWVIALVVLAAVSTCGLAAFFWCRSGDSEKKKKKRGGMSGNKKKPKGGLEVEENTETQALASPESQSVSATPALTAQPVIVHHTLPQVGSGSFVAQAMPVGSVAHPVVAHSFPVASFTNLPAATEPVVTHAHPVAHAYATGVATHLVTHTPVGSASVTPVPAISTPVAYYQHQGQGSVFQQ